MSEVARVEAELEERLKREQMTDGTDGELIPREGHVRPQLEERFDKGENDEAVPS